MGTATFTSTLSNATDADFRSWVGAFVNGLVSAGATKWAGAGQIDPATVLAPTAANQMRGFAVLYLNDALHGAAPVYYRLDFGSGGAAAIPSLRLTVGRGVDAAGTITGVLLAQTALSYSGTTNIVTTTTAYTCLASTGPGYVCFMPFVDDTTASPGRAFFFVIERSRDHNGAPTGDAVTVVYDQMTTGGRALTSASYLAIIRTMNYATAAFFELAPPVTSPYSINGALTGPSTSLAAGGVGPVLPWVLMAPAIAPWQSCCIVSIPSGDFPGGDFTTTLCGNEATFRPIDGAAVPLYSGFGLAVQPGTSSPQYRKYFGPAIRWEA